MTTTRWILSDPATGDTWAMPINPNSMTTPHRDKTLTFAYGFRRLRSTDSRVRTVMQKPEPIDWEWSGVIRTKEHYDAYVVWADKPGAVHVTDHLGRTFEVFIQSFEPEDRVPTVPVPWRLRYSVKTLLMRRVS